MINDFLQSFPWAITIILFLSLLVAVLLVPYIQYHFIHTGFRKQPKEGEKATSFVLDDSSIFLRQIDC